MALEPLDIRLLEPLLDLWQRRTDLAGQSLDQLWCMVDNARSICVVKHILMSFSAGVGLAQQLSSRPVQ
jgi:hypothetical protein